MTIFQKYNQVDSPYRLVPAQVRILAATCRQNPHQTIAITSELERDYFFYIGDYL